jgi:hypothetical protein
MDKQLIGLMSGQMSTALTQLDLKMDLDQANPTTTLTV